MKKLNPTIWAVLAAALVAIACGSGSDDRAGSLTVDGDTPSSSATSRQPEAALPMDGKTAQKYRDGLQVLVSPPTRYKVPATAANHTRGNSAVTFTVTFINGTDQQVDLSLSTITMTAGKQGFSSEPIYADGLSVIYSTGPVAPGRRKTLTLAYSTPTKDLSVIDVTVTPGFLDHSEALFTGKVAA